MATTHTRRRGEAPARAEPGAVTHDGRPMKYDHDTYAAYSLDKCRCVLCRCAARDYNAKAGERGPTMTESGPVILHCKELMAAGVGLKQIAKAAGVAASVCSALIYGKARSDGTTRVPQKLLIANAEAILAVTVDDKAEGKHGPAGTPALSRATWARLNEMIDAGVPKQEIAKALGYRQGGLQIKPDVTRRQADAIRHLHRRWRTGDIILYRTSGVKGIRTGMPVPIYPPLSERFKVNRQRIVAKAWRDTARGMLVAARVEARRSSTDREVAARQAELDRRAAAKVAVAAARVAKAESSRKARVLQREARRQARLDKIIASKERLVFLGAVQRLTLQGPVPVRERTVDVFVRRVRRDDGVIVTEEVREERPWREDVECTPDRTGLSRQELGVLFFPQRGWATAPAKQVCARCPVRAECLDNSIATVEKFGVWGGLSERQRRVIRRERGIDDGDDLEETG